MPLIPHSHAERLAAQAAKRRRLLAWLRLELWTPIDIAGDVMGVRDRRTIRTTLAAMARDGLVTLDSIEIPFGSLRLVGITMDGQSAAAGTERALIGKAYERGRIGLTVLDHSIDLQRLKLACLRAGWKNWVRPDLEKWGKHHRPDAIAVMPDGTPVAIECERTIKTVKRYKAVVANHLGALKKNAYRHVIYTSPTPEKACNVERLLRSLPPLVVAGEKVLPAPVIDSSFSFVTFEHLPTLILKGS